MADIDGSRPHWDIPSVRIGPREIPRLILGDHGFLAKYGSILTEDDIAARMGFALQMSSCGLAAGDETCLHAAQRTLSGRTTTLVYHTDVPLALGHSAVDFARAMSTLRLVLYATAPTCIEDDPIVGRFLSLYAETPPYEPSEWAEFTIDLAAWKADAALATQFRPALTTVGGDFLDFAFAIGRIDLVHEALSAYRDACNKLNAALAVTLYTGCVTVLPEAFPSRLCDAVMVPVNSRGHGMLPDNGSLLSWTQRLGLPLIAMHPLASGSADPCTSLEYVLKEANAAVAIAGASTIPHIEALLHCCHDLLGS